MRSRRESNASGDLLVSTVSRGSLLCMSRRVHVPWLAIYRPRGPRGSARDLQFALSWLGYIRAQAL